MKKRIVFSYLLLLCLAAALVCLGILAGSASIPLRDLLKILSGHGGDDTAALTSEQSKPRRYASPCHMSHPSLQPPPHPGISIQLAPERIWTPWRLR